MTTNAIQFSILALVLAGSNLRAQDALNAAAERPQTFYHPLTLAPAQSDSTDGGGGETGDEALAKQAQNPIAKLISVPFQSNFNFGIGPNNVTEYVLNFQPVIPITLSEDWNLITRWITPVINLPSPAPGIRSAFGLGDMTPSLYLSPAKDSKLLWGVGTTLLFPTATDPLLGSGKWGAGPGLVGVYKSGPWVGGAVVNNVWSFAGWGNQEVNAFYVQPFVNYNLKNAWYLTTGPIMTANWKASSENRWVVPVGGGVGKIFRLGKLPVNTQLSAYYNAVTPRDFGANWQFRVEVSLLFPK